MAGPRPPKIGSSRYYETMWNEWRDEEIAKGYWMRDRRRAEQKRKQVSHAVSYSDFAAELRILADILGSRVPLDFLAFVASCEVVEENGRWCRSNRSDSEQKLTLGRIAARRIGRGHKADPTYAHFAWDCAIEASDFDAAKKQVRDAHEAYLASEAGKLTREPPLEVK